MAGNEISQRAPGRRPAYPAPGAGFEDRIPQELGRWLDEGLDPPAAAAMALTVLELEWKAEQASRPPPAPPRLTRFLKQLGVLTRREAVENSLDLVRAISKMDEISEEHASRAPMPLRMLVEALPEEFTGTRSNRAVPLEGPETSRAALLALQARVCANTAAAWFATLTAQMKISLVIAGSMPLQLVFVLQFIQPAFVEDLFQRHGDVIVGAWSSLAAVSMLLLICAGRVTARLRRDAALSEAAGAVFAWLGAGHQLHGAATAVLSSLDSKHPARGLLSCLAGSGAAGHDLAHPLATLGPLEQAGLHPDDLRAWLAVRLETDASELPLRMQTSAAITSFGLLVLVTGFLAVMVVSFVAFGYFPLFFR